MGKPKFIKEGSVFGILTIEKEVAFSVSPNGSKRRKFKCICSCDNKTEIVVMLSNLKSGHTKSCGCLYRTKQGMSTHPLSKVYYHMQDRCYNKKDKSYKNYGGRGIKICKEWLGEKGFFNFISWNNNLPIKKQWKDKLEIDRKDNDGDYTPDNCRWVTSKVNSNNKRVTVYVEYKGKSYAFSDFHNKYGNPKVSYNAAITRYKRGWNLLSACRTPIN